MIIHIIISNMNKKNRYYKLKYGEGGEDSECVQMLEAYAHGHRMTYQLLDFHR